MLRLSQILREERLKRKLSLDEVSKITKIRANFLSALEKGEYHKLPSRAYAYGFVKNYVEFLNLPKNETLALFRREFNEEKVFKVLPEGFARQDDFSATRIKIQENVGLIILVFLMLLGYILFQYRYAFINPPLEVYSPKEKEEVSAEGITVSGKTDSSVVIYINNVSVSLDKEGNFKKSIDLFPGKSVITIKAVNRFGRETIEKRDIEVKPSI